MKTRLTALVLGLGFCATSFAQNNDDIYSGLQFSFVPPGARSLAMGSAFAGRADDATTAYTNPAGLSWLSDSELGIEIRNQDFITSQPDRMTVRDFSSDDTGLGFLAFVIPKGSWSVAFYRHELSNFELNVPGTQGVEFQVGDRTDRTAGLQADLGLEIVNYGISGSFKVSSNFWVGAGISYYDFELDANSSFFLPERGTPFFGDVNFTEPERTATRVQSGDDDDFGVNLGILWKTDDDRFSFGASYRSAPKFDSSNRFTSGPRVLNPNPEQQARLSQDFEFEVPDLITGGISFRPTESLTLMLDIAHISYSNLEPEVNVTTLVDNLATSIAIVESGNPAAMGTDPAIASRRDALVPLIVDDFDIDDTTEIHIGAEWIVPSNGDLVWALRAGAWHDPENTMTYNASNLGPACDASEPACANIANLTERLNARWVEGDDETHFTGGLGLVFPQGLTVDFAFDLSDRGDVFSLSALWRF